jgi:3-methylcrotonyl-CoA carboxylase alpha subunit
MRIPLAQRFTTGAVRWDSGVREGDEISPYYDSMIAKLIVHGDTREQALARLDQALSELHIVGVANNVAFLRQVVRSPSFAHAHLDTALIQREKDQLFHQQPLPIALAVAAAMVHGLAVEPPRGNAWIDPWSHTDGWLIQGQSLRKFDYVCGEETGAAVLTRSSHGPNQLQIGDQAHALAWQVHGQAVQLQWGEQRLRAQVYLVKDQLHVFADVGSASVHFVNPLAHAAQGSAASGNLSAPMPGKLLSFAVKVGDKVKAGQALAVMEAMKMEHTVAAPADGTVAELLYEPGDQVNEGAPLLRLESQEA